MVQLSPPGGFSSSSALSTVAVLVGLWSFVISAYWIVVGWRAMRAHERIAKHQAEIVEALRELGRE